MSQGRCHSAGRLAIALLAALVLQSGSAAALEVLAPSGAANRVLGADGEIQAEHRPGPAAPAASAAPTSGSGSPEAERVHHRDPVSGRSVDPEGRVSGAEPEAAGLSASATARVTIDRMSFGVTYSDTYDPSSGFVLFGPAKTYFLSDGSSWQSGAGVYYRPRAVFDRVETDGDTLRYYFDPPPEGYLYKQTDYDAGSHSSNGSLGPAGPLVLEARAGSTQGTMSGDVTILSNVPANYSEPRFNYWSAPLGAIVPFEATFTLHNGATFGVTTFDASFRYANDGVVDFADPSSLPPLVGLEILGSAQVRPQSTTPFHAVASYASGARENVTAVAEWSVSPDAAASVAAGDLTTGACDGTVLELRASFRSNDTSRTATRSVECRETSGDEWSAYWETYQGDERHSGYVPIALDPELFELRWRKSVAPGSRLNPVTAADGKVFVSVQGYFRSGEALFSLDARDGEVLWSRDFGDPFSVNPPAYGYGNVYIQTGNHGSDTWLWAFDADTGAQVFQSPHAAQWERYFAPTVHDGSVYVNGGYYGGMYAFDAFSGASLWFAGLPQYDQFTPAVDDEHVYAYVGEYSPALYVVDRETGQQSYRIDDPNFDWSGWSMNLAPVLGGQDDVLAIHDGRLIRFDLANRRIAYEIAASFSGQPAVAKGLVYAINGGAVEARDQADGALRWRWQPPSGAANEHLIVTDTHVLAHTASETHAIERLSGQSEWSFAAAGSLALGEETLYIASADGVLTAIAIPGRQPSALVGLEIEGPAEVQEFTTARYTAWAHYDDGRVRDRSQLCEWSVEPADHAFIGADGLLGVQEMLVPSQQVVVGARYGEDGQEAADTLDVELAISVSLDGFVDRNALAALAAKRRALANLEEAQLREDAAIRVARERARGRPDADRDLLTRTLIHLRRALSWGRIAQRMIGRGVDELESVIADDEAGAAEGSTAAK